MSVLEALQILEQAFSSVEAEEDVEANMLGGFLNDVLFKHHPTIQELISFHH